MKIKVRTIVEEIEGVPTGWILWKVFSCGNDKLTAICLPDIFAADAHPVKNSAVKVFCGNAENGILTDLTRWDGKVTQIENNIATIKIDNATFAVSLLPETRQTRHRYTGNQESGFMTEIPI